MDSRLIYTVAAADLWNRLIAVARRDGGIVSGTPPEMAVELADARLYVTEAPVSDPPEGFDLGADIREFVVDMHNHERVDEFLAEVLDGFEAEAVVDDDQGRIAPSRTYIERVRGSDTT